MGWLFGTRREVNHANWETRDAKQSVTMKAKEAQTQAAEARKKEEKKKQDAKKVAKHTKPRSPWDRSSNVKRRGGWSW
jgi:hypothetical protein